MNVMILFLAICCLAVLAGPVAFLALLLLPVVWLLALPFRILAVVVSALLVFLKTLLLLPARILGFRTRVA